MRLITRRITNIIYLDIHVQMEEDDAKILKEGTVDYVGLSYYMTNAVKADHVTDGNGTLKRSRKNLFTDTRKL